MNIEAQETKRPLLAKTLCFMFSGKAGTGKSYTATIASRISDEFGLLHYKSPFAKGVKDTARFMGWNGEKDVAGRRLLQQIGQVGRDYDEDIWCKKSFAFIEESVDYPFDVVFIDDWRFPNEYDYVNRNQPLYNPIRIRLNAPEREILAGTKEYFDVSETSLDDYTFDYTIHNVADHDMYESFRTILSIELDKNTVK